MHPVHHDPVHHDPVHHDLYTASEIRDTLPLPSKPLKSETPSPLHTASEIRDTLPLQFTTSEIRGIRCL